MKAQILFAKVFHVRHAVAKHKLVHNVYYLSVPLSTLSELAKLKLLSLTKFNLFGLYEKDHGQKNIPAFHGWVEGILAEYHAPFTCADIQLITMPRVLGHVFNPVSFWCCYDEAGALRAVVAEVNNTFGERHIYLAMHEDGRVIGKDDWITSQKVFHVSPFFDIKGHYAFRFAMDKEKMAIWIDYYEAETKLLSTSVSGTYATLSDGGLLRCFFRYPLVTLMVIGLIHYHALRLALKGVAYRRKPAPPTFEVSR